jgi:hypothetical protein
MRKLVVTEVLNNQQKYVASRTLSEPLPWQNSTLLKGDAADAVAALKELIPVRSGAFGSTPLRFSHFRLATGRRR